jgi:hypothetical protein
LLQILGLPRFAIRKVRWSLSTIATVGYDNSTGSIPEGRTLYDDRKGARDPRRLTFLGHRHAPVGTNGTGDRIVAAQNRALVALERMR